MRNLTENYFVIGFLVIICCTNFCSIRDIGSITNKSIHSDENNSIKMQSDEITFQDLPIPEDLDPIFDYIFAYLQVYIQPEYNISQTINKAFEIGPFSLDFHIFAIATFYTYDQRINLTVEISPNAVLSTQEIPWFNSLFAASSRLGIDIEPIIEGTIIGQLIFDIPTTTWDVSVNGEMILGVQFTKEIMDLITLIPPLTGIKVPYENFKLILNSFGIETADYNYVTGSVYVKFGASYSSLDDAGSFSLGLGGIFQAIVTNPFNANHEILNLTLEGLGEIALIQESEILTLQGTLGLEANILLDLDPLYYQETFSLIDYQVSKSFLTEVYPQIEIEPGVSSIILGDSVSYNIKVTDQLGAPIGLTDVTVYESASGGWDYLGTTSTDGSGEFTISRTPTEIGSYTLRIDLESSSSYASIDVQKIPVKITELTINLDSNFAFLDDPVSMWLNLKRADTNAQISGKTITWYAIEQDTGTSITLGTSSTNSYGHTDFTYNSGFSEGNYVIYPEFDGDSSYAFATSENYILTVYDHFVLEIDDLYIHGTPGETTTGKMKVLNLYPESLAVTVTKIGDTYGYLTITPSSFSVSGNSYQTIDVQIAYPESGVIDSSYNLLFEYGDQSTTTQVFTGDLDLSMNEITRYLDETSRSGDYLDSFSLAFTSLFRFLFSAIASKDFSNSSGSDITS